MSIIANGKYTAPSVKYIDTTGSAGAPSGMLKGEIVVNLVDSKVYYCTDNSGTTSSSPLAAASSGASWGAAVTGTPGTGTATLTGVGRAVPVYQKLRNGACYLVYWTDGTAWEYRYGFWNGTTVTRPSGGFVSSSTGSGLTLTSAATATIVDEVGQFTRVRAESTTILQSIFGSASPSSLATPTASTAGTPTSVSFADTNIFTREPQIKQTSGTTANSDAGRYGAILFTSRNASYHMSCRWGASALPTNPRLLVGMNASTSALAADPSSLLDIHGFGCDAADAGVIQFMVNDASGTATKTSTGLTFAINTLYESSVWCDAGGNCYGLIVDYTNSAVWYGSATTDLPTASTGITYRMEGALNGTNTGTAITFHTCNLYIRTGT